MAERTVDDRSYLAGEFGAWWRQYAESIKALPACARASMREDLEHELATEKAGGDRERIGTVKRVLYILAEVESHRAAADLLKNIGRKTPGAA